VLKGEKAEDWKIKRAIDILGAIGPAAKEALPLLIKRLAEPAYKEKAEAAIRKIRDQK
jgi:hypothetical protein